MAYFKHFWKGYMGRFWYFDITTGSGEKKSPLLRPCQKLNFGQKCNYLTKTAFFWPKIIFFADLTPKKFTIMTQKTMLLWWPCCMAAVGAHFWPKKCTFGQISAFLAQNQFLAQSYKGWFFFAWPCCDIKISKPPYVPFSKMFELCHFLSLLDLPERNYMWLSFLITL